MNVRNVKPWFWARHSVVNRSENSKSLS